MPDKQTEGWVSVIRNTPSRESAFKAIREKYQSSWMAKSDLRADAQICTDMKQVCEYTEYELTHGANSVQITRTVAQQPNVELRDGVGSRLSQPKEISK